MSWGYCCLGLQGVVILWLASLLGRRCWEDVDVRVGLPSLSGCSRVRFTEVLGMKLLWSLESLLLCGCGDGWVTVVVVMKLLLCVHVDVRSPLLMDCFSCGVAIFVGLKSL